MSGKESEALIHRLEDEGWKKSTMAIYGEDFYFFKGYDEYEGKYGDTMYRYQILILFYDWRKFRKVSETSELLEGDLEVSLTTIVMPLDLMETERVDLTLSSFIGITGIERIARKYYEWVRKNFKCKER